MPHYSDGTGAKVGDRARGYCTGAGLVLEGIVVTITPGADTCDCHLAYPVLLRSGDQDDGTPIVSLTSTVATLKDLEKVG